jgi:hypothetical protein
MLAISSTFALRYYNYCTDGSTSPGNYGYPFFKNFKNVFACLYEKLAQDV